MQLVKMLKHKKSPKTHFIIADYRGGFLRFSTLGKYVHDFHPWGFTHNGYVEVEKHETY